MPERNPFLELWRAGVTRRLAQSLRSEKVRNALLDSARRRLDKVREIPAPKLPR